MMVNPKLRIFIINKFFINLGINIKQNKMKAFVFISFVSLSLLSCQSELEETIVTENDQEVQEQRYLDYVAKRNSFQRSIINFKKKLMNQNITFSLTLIIK